MNNILLKLDLVSESPKLYINNNTKHYSFLGSILSILIIIGICLFTWFIGNDIIYKTKPKVINKEVFLEKFFKA